jgi:hypothetical protein
MEAFLENSRDELEVSWQDSISRAASDTGKQKITGIMVMEIMRDIYRPPYFAGMMRRCSWEVDTTLTRSGNMIG